MPPSLIVVLRLAGAAVILHALWQLMRIRASHGWRSVPGEILDAQLAYTRMSTPGFPHRITNAKLRYRYEVDGVTREGTRISVAGDLGTSTGGGPRADVATYTFGSQVMVLVNPANADDAALNRNPAAAWFAAAVGVGFIVGPALFSRL